MKKKIIPCIIILLALAMGFSSTVTNDIFANAGSNEISNEDTNQINGTMINSQMDAVSTYATAIPNDVSSNIDVMNLKAWINGSLVYEKGNVAKFPDSIYNGISFKVGLNWQLKNATPLLKDGDFFVVEIGTVEGLGIQAEKKESLYINNILVGESTVSYVGNQLSYKVSFNNAISYFQNITGNFTNSSTFNNITVGNKIVIDFGADGKGDIEVVEKPATPPTGDGNVGVGLPIAPPISKDKITIGKSTYFQDINPIYGWRIVFTDLLHQNQEDLANVTNPVYEDVIIEDTLDENQVFMDEVESGYKAPFFLDIPLLLPGTQNAIAYTKEYASSTRINQVSSEGNGNSDYIIKPTGFQKLTSEEAVRNTPLSWAIVEKNNRQKLIVNVGKLGTTDKTKGITTDLVEARYSALNTKPITEIGDVIQDELNKYSAVLNHEYSPYRTLQVKYDAFKALFASNPSVFTLYETQFNSFLVDNGNGVLFNNTMPPAIPTDLQLPGQEAYTKFNEAINTYNSDMTTYIEKMSEGTDYKNTVKEMVEGLEKAKIYYPIQGKRLYGFNLKYKTKIENTSSGKISNEAIISTGKTNYAVESEVKHSYSSGISGVFTKGDVVIMKADSVHNYTEGMLPISKDLIGMKDIEFEVYDANTDNKLYFFNKAMSANDSYQFHGTSATGSNFTDTLTTDNNGKIIISGLSSTGKYYIKEKTKLDGYYGNQNQKIPFEVDSSKINYKLVENLSRSVTLKKLDKNAEMAGNPAELKGAVFALYDNLDQEVKSFKKETIGGKVYFSYSNVIGDEETLITQDDGTLSLINLPAGEYYLKEVQAPLGFILSDERHPFTLLENYTEGASTIDLGNVYNLKSNASITIQKIDDKSRLPLENAGFQLFKRETGNAWIQGSHTEWSLVSAEMFNKNNKFITSQALKGNTLMSDNNGNISISSLEEGDYYLKEVEAPKGYMLEQTHYHFNVGPLTQQSKLYVSSTLDEATLTEVINNQVVNQKGKASIKLIKYDSSKGAFVKVDDILQDLNKVFYEDAKTQFIVEKPLKGVVFDLYRQDQVSIDTNIDTKIASSITTDVNGELLMKDLEVGTYYFVETKALENYELIKDPIIFNVTQSDVQKNSVSLVKLVNNHKKDKVIIYDKMGPNTMDRKNFYFPIMIISGLFIVALYKRKRIN